VIQASSWGLGLAPLAASPEGEEAHAESLEDAARLARENGDSPVSVDPSIRPFRTSHIILVFA